MPTALPFSDAEQTAAELDAALPAGGGLVLLEGVSEPDAVALADALARQRALRLHRVSASDLLNDEFDALQGNLREAFDAAPGAVFLLTGVEVLLNARPRRAADEPAEPPPAERLRRYLLDRITAFDGVVALSAAGPVSGLDEVRAQAVVVSA